MKKRLLQLAAVALFTAPMVGTHAATQTLGRTLSRPFGLRAGIAETFEMQAPAKTNKVRICVNRKSHPVQVQLRKMNYTVFPGTCKTRRTNRALGIKRPKLTKFVLSLSAESGGAGGWVHFVL